MIYKNSIYKNFLIFVFLFFSSTYICACMNVSVKAKKSDKLKIKIILVGKATKAVREIANIIQKDLEFSGQFQVIREDSTSGIVRTKDITGHFDGECRLGIFLTMMSKNTLGWRLYDLEYAQMVKGEKYKIKGRDFHGWAHNISDLVWPNLTGEKGFFSTKIAYCKKINCANKSDYKHVYIADYDGSNEKLLVSTPTINVIPRWNNDPKCPLIFYSEHTNKNVRLMVVNLQGKRKVASNFDGLNILSTFSPDGKRFAYCASRGNGLCQIYYYDGELKKLTSKGNNICPTFADNGNTIYFCSDMNSKNCTRIYKYDLGKRENTNYIPECILNTGFEVSTAFCPVKNRLAYAKMVRGTMQIFVYNPEDKTHKQVTLGAGNKEECSWSPCGNYLVFSVRNGNKSRLAVLNLLTGVMKPITKPADSCYYPNWSPFYDSFPCVV